MNFGRAMGAQFPPHRYREAALIAEFGLAAGDVALSRAVLAYRSGANTMPALEVTEIALRLLVSPLPSRPFSGGAGRH